MSEGKDNDVQEHTEVKPSKKKKVLGVKPRAFLYAAVLQQKFTSLGIYKKLFGIETPAFLYISELLPTNHHHW